VRCPQRQVARELLRFFTVLLWLHVAPACAAELPAGELGAGSHDLSIAVGGERRHYVVHLPARSPGDPPVPLLLAFHGGGGNGQRFREYAGLDAIANREGFAVAYPDGTGRLGRRLLTWNAGGCCGRAARENADDVAFVRALVGELAQRVRIDPARVYATGHSNGGMMSYRLAVEAPDLVAAIAPVGGAMILGTPELASPVPVLHIHSVDDPRALYEGGLGPPFPLTRHRVLHSAVETELSRWVAANGCAVAPHVLERSTDPESGHTATLLSWEPCESGSPVLLWRLTGAGHGWPGSEGRSPERLVGPRTEVISAAEETWRFLSRQRLRRPSQEFPSAASIATP
jgi:polyhydroxybutyrate depolymerase